MKNTNRTLIAIILATSVLFFFALPAASAAGAATVVVNGVTLDADAPYWQNGGTAALAAEPADGWNAYFNAAESTLTLSDAALDTPAATASSHPQNNMIYADGDLALELIGTNTLTFDGSSEHGIFAVYTDGAISVDGEGSMAVNIRNTYYDAANAGFFIKKGFTCTGGSLSIDIHGEDVVFGVAAEQFLHAGGTTDINITCNGGHGIYGERDVRITGGSIAIRNISTGGVNYALTGKDIYLDGGKGRFLASGAQPGYGAKVTDGSLYASGGRFILAGGQAALTSEAATRVIISGVGAYTSGEFNGSGKRLWMYAAPGEVKESQHYVLDFPFRYLEFIPPLAPQTGDGQSPLAWTGAALCALLLAAAFGLTARRKRA